MGIIYLILKILLGIIITVIGLIILLGVLILTLPIDYFVECEKYEAINLYSKIRIFYILTIIYHLKEGQNILDFRLFGRQINKEHVEIEEIKEAAQETTEDLIKVEEKVAEQTTPLHPGEQSTKQSVQDSKIKNKEKIRKATDKPLKDEKGKKKQEAKQPQVKALWEDIKMIWESEYRIGFIRGIKKLISGLFEAIKPRRFKFNVTVGGEDPAQTGEWLAAASLLYPLYGKYGYLQGNFEEKGFWGETNIEGRVRLYKILKVLLTFLINKSVRNYVKIILNIRKEERNGVSIK